MEYFKQFQNHIDNNDYPAVVSLWQEYCLSDEIDESELKAILLAIKNSSLAPSFGKYVEQILLLWESLGESEIKHEILSLVYDIQTTNDQALFDFVLNYLEKHYPNDKNMAQKLKLVGLKEGLQFQGAIRNFDLLTHMKVGNFFIHTGGWGVGEVMEISMLREQITLEFDYVSGFKELSFINAFNNLVPISKEHFLARRFGDPESFESFAKTKPVETIRMLLKDLGPKTAFEIKEELCELVISEEDWTRWWGSVRSKLKKDTVVEVPAESKGVFKLCETEISHEDRLLKALGKKPKPDKLIELIYTFIRDFSAALKNEPFKETLKTELANTLASQEISDSQEVEILFILQDLCHEKAKNLKDVICNLVNLQNAVSNTKILAHKKRLLSEIRKHREDWPENFAELLETVDQNPLRDYLFDKLLKEKKIELLENKIEELITDPKKTPATLVWYFQKAIKVKDCPLSDQEGLNRLFEAFFILLHQIETDASYRDLVKKMHKILTEGRFANVRKIFKGASEELVKEILLLSTKCQTLTSHEIKILYSLAEVVHPALGHLNKNSEEEELIIWTTEGGYRKVKERMEQIATVETVENAKEIETARAHGDLRENSEYKFALEKRSRLQGELKFLSSQIKQMRILTKEDIDTSKVSVGTAVSLKDEKGKKLTYTLLGPWDADPDQGVLSFQSKIAKTLLDKKQGDKVDLNEESWKIEKIESVL